MLVKFGYCILCDSGPNRKNQNWVEDIVRTEINITYVLKHCSNCGTTVPNKNLLYIEVNVKELN